MKRYYSETIPNELGIKLQDAGMPVDWEDNTPDEDRLIPDVGCLTTYGEVFDKLGEKGCFIGIFPRWKFSTNKLGDWLATLNGTTYNFWLDWFDAAEEAILQALKMLKEDGK